MTARATTNTRVLDELEVEMPFAFDADDDARQFWIRATVKFGRARAWVTNKIVCIDQRTHQIEDITDEASLEAAEVALIDEAKRMTRRAWT